MTTLASDLEQLRLSREGHGFDQVLAALRARRQIRALAGEVPAALDQAILVLDDERTALLARLRTAAR